MQNYHYAILALSVIAIIAVRANIQFNKLSKNEKDELINDSSNWL